MCAATTSAERRLYLPVVTLRQALAVQALASRDRTAFPQSGLCNAVRTSESPSVARLYFRVHSFSELRAKPAEPFLRTNLAR